MKVLELDLGNTACKWRLIDAKGATVLQRGRLQYSETAQALEFNHQPDAVYIASVASEDAIQTMKQLLDLPKTVQFNRITSSNRLACVENGYRDPQRLGVDRWLALCAAFLDGKYAGAAEPVLVIDCGSAITVDFVDRAGCHKGGYILPGLQMMLKSLAQGTADVGAHSPAKSIAPGQITDEAVGHGVIFNAVALIEKAIREAQASLKGVLKVYLTGGDAPTLMPFLPESIIYKEDLVLDGITCFWREQQV